MKILFIHKLFSSECSGASTIVFSTYDMLNKNGHESYIFATDSQPYVDEGYEYIKYFPKNIQNWESRGIIGYLKKLSKKIYNKEAQVKLSQMLDEIKPDIVHIHSVWELSYAIIKPIKERKIPIIYTAHDVSYCCPAIFAIGKQFCNKCVGLSTYPCTIKKCVNNNFFNSFYYSIKAYFDRFNCPISSFKKIIVPSQATLNYMAMFKIPKNQIVMIENFLLKEYLNQKPNYTNQGYFLYCGGLNKAKGIYTLLEAMKTLPNNIELHIAGEVDKDIYLYMNDMKLSSVKFLGRISKRDLAEEFKNCISAIMPSEYFETFGMIIIEAAAHGKPTIGANIGAIPDVIDNNITGQLFKSGDIEQLKNCILKYWNNPDLAIVHGKNAYQKVHEKYTEEKYYYELMKIYNEVLNND